MEENLPIVHHWTAALQSLAVELGITSAEPSPEQIVADIAIDFFNFCLRIIMSAGEIEGIPFKWKVTAIELEGQLWTFDHLEHPLWKETNTRSRPIILTFSGERAAAIRRSMNHLGQCSEKRLLTNAISLLHTMVGAKRRGHPMIVYRMHSELHAKPSRSADTVSSMPPVPNKKSLLD